MIHSFESALISGHLISTSFKNIKNNVHEFKKRRFGFLFSFFVLLFPVIRSPIVLYFDHLNMKSQENATMDIDVNSNMTLDNLSPFARYSKYEFVTKFILGDYLLALGNSGRIVHILWITFSVMALIYR